MWSSQLKTNRLIRMLLLKAEALEIESELTREKDAQYEAAFREEFAEVTSFLLEKQMAQLEEIIVNKAKNKEAAHDDIDNVVDKEEKNDALKKIYRALARETHPDLTGDEGNEFRDIQKAYNENDVSALLTAANKHSIDIELSDEDADFLENRIREQKLEIDKMRQSVRWVWGNDKIKSKSLRIEIIKSMGADPQEFEAWRKSKRPKGD